MSACWLRQYSFNGPTIFDTIRNRCGMESGVNAPFRNCHRAFIPCQTLTHWRIAIVRLLCPCRPSDVARFVISILIGPTIQRVLLGWTQADRRNEVSAKINKGCAPTRPYGDTTAAISSVVRMIWVFAALNHPDPDHVFRRAVEAVFRVRQFVHFTLIAAARRGAAEFQTAVQDGCCPSAVAATQPSCAIVRSPWAIRLNNFQAAESLPGEVFNLASHAPNSTLLGAIGV